MHFYYISRVSINARTAGIFGCLISTTGEGTGTNATRGQSWWLANFAHQDSSWSHTPFYYSNRINSCPKYIYDWTKVYILGRRSQFTDVKSGEAANTGVRQGYLSPPHIASFSSGHMHFLLGIAAFRIHVVTPSIIGHVISLKHAKYMLWNHKNLRSWAGMATKQ